MVWQTPCGCGCGLYRLGIASGVGREVVTSEIGDYICLADLGAGCYTVKLVQKYKLEFMHHIRYFGV